VFNFERCERSERKFLKFLIQALVECDTVSIGEKRYYERYIAYIFRKEQSEYNEMYLQKLVIFVYVIKD
jgi:hypothetical protein